MGITLFFLTRFLYDDRHSVVSYSQQFALETVKFNLEMDPGAFDVPKEIKALQKQMLH